MVEQKKIYEKNEKKYITKSRNNRNYIEQRDDKKYQNDEKNVFFSIKQKKFTHSLNNGYLNSIRKAFENISLQIRNRLAPKHRVQREKENIVLNIKKVSRTQKFQWNNGFWSNMLLPWFSKSSLWLSFQSNSNWLLVFFLLNFQLNSYLNVFWFDVNFFFTNWWLKGESHCL